MPPYYIHPEIETKPPHRSVPWIVLGFPRFIIRLHAHSGGLGKSFPRMFASPFQMRDLHDRVLHRRPRPLPSVHAHLPHRVHRRLAHEELHLPILHGARRRRPPRHLRDALEETNRNDRLRNSMIDDDDILELPSTEEQPCTTTHTEIEKEKKNVHD